MVVFRHLIRLSLKLKITPSAGPNSPKTINTPERLTEGNYRGVGRDELEGVIVWRCMEECIS